MRIMTEKFGSLLKRWLATQCVVLFAMLSSCGSPMNDERVVSNISLTTSESGGTYSGAFSAGSGLPQLMSVSSGALSGSSVMIPPGALNIDLSISVSSSTSLATAAQIGDLGLSGVTLSAAGPAVNFAPSSDVELATPMLLSIPLLSSSLWLDDSVENLVVVYKAISIKDGATEILSGLIPRSDLIVSSSVVKFKTSRFGAFQVVKTSSKVETAISKPSSDKIGVVPGAELVGEWRGCKAETHQGSPYAVLSIEKFNFKSDGTLLFKTAETNEQSPPPICDNFDGTAGTGAIFSITITGKFAAGSFNDAIAPTGATTRTREIDFYPLTIAVTPLTSYFATSLSSNAKCGFTDWAVDTPKSLSDLSCFNGKQNDLQVGGTMLDIFALGKDAAGKRLLYFGDGSSGETRPTSFGSEPEAVTEL